MTSRALALLVTVVAHVALIALLAGSRAIHYGPPRAERRMMVVLLPQEFALTRTDAEAGSSRGSRRAAQAADLAPGRPGIGATLTEPLRPPSASAPNAPVDWLRESELAARRQVDALASDRRRNRDLVSRGNERVRAKPASPAPEFAWDRAHTQRIEPLPTGGTLIHLNDRCVIVLSGLIMPACTLGRIEARGDLFEHMNDLPPLGD